MVHLDYPCRPRARCCERSGGGVPKQERSQNSARENASVV